MRCAAGTRSGYRSLKQPGEGADGMVMADVLTLPRVADVTVAAHPAAPTVPAGLDRLPGDWTIADGVDLGPEAAVDHVVVGPNGVFTIAIDRGPGPVRPGQDGLYRGDLRVTGPVKHALTGAHRLRQRLGLAALAYPILVASLDLPAHRLERLGVVPGDRLAEHIWSHPGFPLRRSQRHEILWQLRRLR